MTIEYDNLATPSESTEPTECNHCGSENHQHGYIADKESYLRRMKRLEGQARGIAKMIEEEKYCIDILTQISALTKAAQGVATGLLEDHLHHCVLDAAHMQDEQLTQEKIAEASSAIKRLMRF
ncbi:metal-sensitive transcriptional regulator [Corynebacterium sp. 320]|uniref:Metal-sensitive transcriptional regulator n=1 Tax=Corynebacterium zhongnanshanii TaxID=2768834 RepID=A0ABQ6VDP7_9CORY|nr:MULTISPECIES: metal-sensitive transcriptional regulator [Corynebacterium]KAB1501321.1 metal-sensitive transcriptional regulator [Corynebacterium sp. 320]KAB1551490.1 metal-sensitive transcriptional regulator [Corynebacterium sp. 321]KAB1551682.1 metal-sensitive transcriptional regulator [Corynebacterium sp. 319]KAB3521032.1 metal-sensitive transcriptional regulator [Corynebacterium zhongnanshanii]KAB3525686.1 metal-sensitive transcriptional regulator [Corynebacterium sp. 250]